MIDLLSPWRRLHDAVRSAFSLTRSETASLLLVLGIALLGLAAKWFWKS